MAYVNEVEENIKYLLETKFAGFNVILDIDEELIRYDDEDGQVVYRRTERNKYHLATLIANDDLYYIGDIVFSALKWYDLEKKHSVSAYSSLKYSFMDTFWCTNQALVIEPTDHDLTIHVIVDLNY